MKTIKTIVKGVAACLTFFIVGAAILLDTIIDAIYSILRNLRYQYYKCIRSVLKIMNIDTYCINGWNRMMHCISVDDAEDAKKFDNLRF